MGWKNIKIQSWEKIIKSAICNLSWFRMFIKKVQSSQNSPEKSYTEKKLGMNLLVGWCLQDAHLIKKKINLIITEEKIVLKIM